MPLVKNSLLTYYKPVGIPPTGNQRPLKQAFLPPATKLGQGNVFTGICDSVNRGGGVPGPGGSAPGGEPSPSGRPLLRVVRILLECILVLMNEPRKFHVES